jgi:hypothetical protein
LTRKREVGMGIENVVVGPAFPSGLEDSKVAGIASLTGFAGGFSADRKGLRGVKRTRGQVSIANLPEADRHRARKFTRVRHSEQNSLPQASKHG